MGSLPVQILFHLCGSIRAVGTCWRNIGFLPAAAGVLSVSLALSACQTNRSNDAGRLAAQAAERQAKLASERAAPEFVIKDKDQNPQKDKAELAKKDDIGPSTRLGKLMAGSGQNIKVGLILPLSGDAAVAGRDLRDAALMAMFDLGDGKLQILPRDSKGTPDGARAAAQTLIEEGVHIILGPLLRENVKAVAVLTRAADVPVIAFSSDRNVAQPGVFLLSFTPYQEIYRVVSFARERGIERFAIFAPDSEYSRSVVSALEEILPQVGGELLQEAYYNPDGSDLQAKAKRFAAYELRLSARRQRMRELQNKDTALARRQLRQLQRRKTYGGIGIQAVLVPDVSGMLIQVASTLDYYDVDLRKIKLLGTGLWSDPLISREPSVQGGWFATPAPEVYTAFAARFKELYGRENIRIATLAYDAAALTAVLGQQENGFSIENLTLASGFDGKDGLFRFLANGRAERGLTIMEVRPREFKVIDPAPTTFPDVGT